MEPVRKVHTVGKPFIIRSQVGLQGQLPGQYHPHRGRIHDGAQQLNLLDGVLIDELVRLVHYHQIPPVHVEELTDFLQTFVIRTVTLWQAQLLLYPPYQVPAAHGLVALDVDDTGQPGVLLQAVGLTVAGPPHHDGASLLLLAQVADAYYVDVIIGFKHIRLASHPGRLFLFQQRLLLSRFLRFFLGGKLAGNLLGILICHLRFFLPEGCFLFLCLLQPPLQTFLQLYWPAWIFPV